MSYDILISLIGREIERHIAEDHLEKIEKAGFIKGGNVLDNFILRKYVDETYIQEK